jgi:hypothetical protein
MRFRPVNPSFGSKLVKLRVFWQFELCNMHSHFSDKKRSGMQNNKIRSVGRSAHLSESIKISTKTHEYHIAKLNVGKRITKASTLLRD